MIADSLITWIYSLGDLYIMLFWLKGIFIPESPSQRLNQASFFTIFAFYLVSFSFTSQFRKLNKDFYMTYILYVWSASSTWAVSTCTWHWLFVGGCVSDVGVLSVRLVAVFLFKWRKWTLQSHRIIDQFDQRWLFWLLWSNWEVWRSRV